MNRIALLVLVGSVAVAFGRFTVPGHGLSYAGTYEAFAHMWVGALIVLAFRKDVRTAALSWLGAITALETVMFFARAAAVVAIFFLIVDPAFALDAATQNTITTTAPVTSETTISVGTWAGQTLLWVVATFGSTLGLALTTLIVRMLKNAGVVGAQLLSDKLDQLVLHGLNFAADEAAKDMAGKGTIEIKDDIAGRTLTYVQQHGADTIKALGMQPESVMAIEAIKARIATAVADPDKPTPAVLDPKPAPHETH